MLQQKSFVYLRALCGSSFCCSVCIGVSVSLRWRGVLDWTIERESYRVHRRPAM